MKVLISPALNGRLGERIALALPEHQVLLFSPEDMVDADVLISSYFKVPAQVMDGSTVQLVHPFGVGYDAVDMEYAIENGIWVANVPSGPSLNAASVAEHTLMLLLSAFHQLNIGTEMLRTGAWGRVPARLLLEKTVLLIGLGGIGEEVAKRLSGFGVKVIGVRKNVSKPIPFGVDEVFGVDELDSVLPLADAIVLAAPADQHTINLIGERTLKLVKKGVVVVNVGRGTLIDEDALLTALDQEVVFSAGLDVFRQEPLPAHHRLANHPRVVGTPHYGGGAVEALDGITDYVIENLRLFAQGKMLQSAVNSPLNPRRPLD